jgi:hypothetical protein
MYSMSATPVDKLQEEIIPGFSAAPSTVSWCYINNASTSLEHVSTQSHVADNRFGWFTESLILRLK